MNHLLRINLLVLLVAAFALQASGCKKVSRSSGDAPVLPPLDMTNIDRRTPPQELLSIENQIPKREAYVIGPGDIMSLSLVGRPDLLGVDEDEETGFLIRVTDSPTVTLPYIGAVEVHGKTVAEIEESIGEKYQRIVKDPAPVLTVDSFNDNTFAVIGSVQQPGRYQLEVGTTVLEAIFQAGGLSFGGQAGALPPSRVMKIYRNKLTKKERFTLPPEELVERLSVGGNILTREEITLPLDEFLLGGDLTWNIPVQQNDIIYLPPAGTVSVTGNVNSPRVVFLGPGLRTLTQVLTETGGMRFSAKSTLEVVRTRPNGTTESYFIHGRDAMRRQRPDFYLQDNDQVFVYKSNARTFFEFIGDIFKGSTQAGVRATYSPVSP